MIIGVVPHLGRAVTGSGASTVFICGLPAIIEGGETVCAGSINLKILGSATFFAMW
jgi:uncharacterized Zn-binding protein involved in type VI secretion